MSAMKSPMAAVKAKSRAGAPTVNASEARDIGLLLNELSFLHKNNKHVPVPKKLLTSSVPCICIPMFFGGARNASVRTWADLANSDGFSPKYRARLALVVCLLASSEGAAMLGSELGTFESPYECMLTGGDEDSRKTLRHLQKDALRLLGLEARRVRRGDSTIRDATLAYFDNNNFWMFFMDGRVNMDKALVRTKDLICSAQDKSRPLLVESLRQYAESPKDLLRKAGFLDEDVYRTKQINGATPLFVKPEEEAKFAKCDPVQRKFTEELLFRFRPLPEHPVSMDGPHEFVSVRVPAGQSATLASWPIPCDLRAALQLKLKRISQSEVHSTSLEKLKLSVQSSLRIASGEGLLDEESSSSEAIGSEDALVDKGHNVADAMPAPSTYQREEGIDIVQCKSGVRPDGTRVGVVSAVASVQHLANVREQQIQRRLEDSEADMRALAQEDEFDERPYEPDERVYRFPDEEAEDDGSEAFVDEFVDLPEDESGAAKGREGDFQVDANNLSMFQGVHMIEEFKRRSIFQRLREDNAVERRRIGKAHAQGTEDYNEAMLNLKNAQLEKFVHAFFTSNTIPGAIFGMRAWWTKSETTQMPEILLEMEGHTPFANFMMRRYMDIDAAFQPGRQMEAAMLCHISSTAGFCHNMLMRPAVLLLGPASTGKSYVMGIAKKLMPPGTTAEVVYSTLKTGMSNTDETDCCVIEQEVSREKLGVDRHGNSVSVDPWIKNMFTNQVITTRYMEHRQDPETGKVVREDKMCVKRYERAFLGASNDPVSGNEDPMIERFTKYVLHATTEEDSRITALMHKPDWATPAGVKKEVCEKYQALYALVAFAEKAIESNAIEEPNMDAMCEMKEMLEFVQSEYGMDTDNPKSFDKMHSLCRLLTLQYAVYMAVCSENGRDLRVFESTGEARRLEKDYTLGADVLKRIEKYAVCTREIVVYVFSLLRSEWMEETFQRVFDAVRARYLGMSSGLETRSAYTTATAQFGGLSTSRIYSELGNNPDEVRDATYLVISPEGGSMSYRNAAAALHKAIPGENIPAGELEKVLRRMSNTTVTGNLYAIERSTYRRNMMPNLCQDPETQRTFTSQYSMVVCSAVTPTAGPIPFCTDNASIQPKQDSHRSFDANEQKEKNLSSMEAKQMWMGIAYDLVRNKRSASSIVNSAISSLAHAYQLGDTQTFVTSLPIEREVLRPAPVEDRSLGVTTKKRRAMFYQLPSVYSMQYRLRMRFINNPQPILAYMKLHLDTNEVGPMAESAGRRCVLDAASSSMMVVDVEPDMLALHAHHTKCGIEPDANLHPSAVLEPMKKIRDRIMASKAWNNYDSAVAELVNNWNHRRQLRTMKNYEFNSADEMNHTLRALSSSVGMMSQMVRSNVLLTDKDLDMGNGRERFRRAQAESAKNLFKSMIIGDDQLQKRLGMMKDRMGRLTSSSSSLAMNENVENERRARNGSVDGLLCEGSLPAAAPSSATSILDSEISNSAITNDPDARVLMDAAFSQSAAARYSNLSKITASLANRGKRERESSSDQSLGESGRKKKIKSTQGGAADSNSRSGFDFDEAPPNADGSETVSEVFTKNPSLLDRVKECAAKNTSYAEAELESNDAEF